MNKENTNRESFTFNRNSLISWFIALFAALVILVIGVGLMYGLGLFAIPKDDTGTKTLAASLGLVGSMLASAVTLVGLVIKSSVDDRNFALSEQAEQRNRIDTIIRAVDLLGENNQDAATSQIGGALLALVSLEETNLAVELLAELWPHQKVSDVVAGSVLRSALKTDSDETQINAAAVLLENASRIYQYQDKINIWPISGSDWRMDLCEDCRSGLVEAAVEWLKMEIKENENEFPIAAIVLYKALEDHGKRIADIAAACLTPVAEKFQSRLPQEAKDLKERLAKHGNPIRTAKEDKLHKEIAALYASVQKKQKEISPE